MLGDHHKNALRGKSSANAPDRAQVCERFAATQGLKRLARMWTTPLLLVLLDGPRRFAELERALAPISAKVLTQRLKELEREGHIARVEWVSEPPKTVEYRLTPLGAAIGPVLNALAGWERAVRNHLQHHSDQERRTQEPLGAK